MNRGNIGKTPRQTKRAMDMETGEVIMVKVLPYQGRYITINGHQYAIKGEVCGILQVARTPLLIKGKKKKPSGLWPKSDYAKREQYYELSQSLNDLLRAQRENSLQQGQVLEAMQTLAKDIDLSDEDLHREVRKMAEFNDDNHKEKYDLALGNNHARSLEIAVDPTLTVESLQKLLEEG